MGVWMIGTGSISIKPQVSNAWFIDENSKLFSIAGKFVMQGDSLLLDYDDYEDDIKTEKSAAKYLAFVKSKRNPVHYIV